MPTLRPVLYGIRGYDTGPLILSGSGWWWEGKQEIEKEAMLPACTFLLGRFGLRDITVEWKVKEAPSRELVLSHLLGLWKSWSTWVLLVPWHLQMWREDSGSWCWEEFSLLYNWPQIWLWFLLVLAWKSQQPSMQCQLTFMVTHSPKLPRSLSAVPRAHFYHAEICSSFRKWSSPDLPSTCPGSGCICHT